MLSSRCRERNATIIPDLLHKHAALFAGDPDLIDMSTAENWLMREELVERFRTGGALQGLSNADLSYPQGIGGSLSVRHAMAALINNHFDPAIVVDPSHIVTAAGASYALDALIEQICDPGDSVMIAAPYWSGLDISFSVHNKAKVLRVHVPLDDFFAVSSVGYYEKALRNSTDPVKAILVCNPHNPLGRCYSRHTLQALLDFCGRHHLHYISDEVYAMSVHSRKSQRDKMSKFVSALSLTGGRGLVHMIYSLSKDFGCSGIRLGAIITQQNEPIRLGSALSTHSQVSSFAGLLATHCILDENKTALFIEKNSRQLRGAYKVMRKFLLGQQIYFLPANAGMFVFARLTSGDANYEQRLQQQMKEHGIVLASGSNYHMNQPGWFRISYALSPSVVAEGLLRIDKSLKALRLHAGAIRNTEEPPQHVKVQGRKRKRSEEKEKEKEKEKV